MLKETEEWPIGKVSIKRNGKSFSGLSNLTTPPLVFVFWWMLREGGNGEIYVWSIHPSSFHASGFGAKRACAFATKRVPTRAT